MAKELKFKQQHKVSRWILAGILLFTIVLFSNSLTNQVLVGWDDGEYISNEGVQQFRVTEFFSTYYLGMYQPLGVLSFSVNYLISGDKPAPYHLTNLLIHLLNIVLVFLFIQRLSGKYGISALVTLLFAIHPMHVEAVSWIATRSNGLYTAFFLASLIFYLKFLEKREKKFYLYCLGAFLLSLFSKSMAVTLPMVLLLLDYYRENTITRKKIIEKIPFFALSLVFGFIAIDASSTFGHISNLATSYSIIDRFFLLTYGVVFYIYKAFVPVNLSAVYAYPEKTEGGFLPAEYYISALILLGIILFVIFFRKNRKDNIFGSLFFILTISVALPLVWSRMLMLSDRYTYIPYIGIFLAMAYGLNRFMNSANAIMQKIRLPAAFIGIALLAWYSATTFQRNKIWENALTLTTDIIEKNRSDLDVSIGYFFRGNIRDRMNDVDGALKDFSKAIELNPAYTLAYNNRGIILGLKGEMENALADFNKAIELEPDYRDAYYNRGNVKYYMNWKQEACLDWQKAAALGSEQAEKIRNKYCN